MAVGKLVFNRAAKGAAGAGREEEEEGRRSGKECSGR